MFARRFYVDSNEDEGEIGDPSEAVADLGQL
jgi:hypothetical protein